MLSVPRSQHALQSRHWFPCSLAGQLLPSVTTVDVQGQKLAAGLFILCPDNLIIKFLGILSKFNGKNLASRLGSQCLVPGVSLHTSKIFFKCCTPCRSPESCHLNHGVLSINTTIAGIHSGCVKLSSLLFRAACTLPNLYRPFRA